MNDPLYTEILKQAEQIAPNPEGLSNHTPQSKTDQTIIKQNNTIILLLLKLNENIERLIKGKTIEDHQDLLKHRHEL